MRRCRFRSGGIWLSALGVGETGTACAGTTFTITLTDAASGTYSFVPATPIVLGSPGSATQTCTIDFAVSVLKTPTKDVTPATPGMQTRQVAAVTGVTSVSNLLATGFNESFTTVSGRTLLIGTSATPTTMLGNPIVDAAGFGRPPTAPDPTGTVTFTLYGPGDTGCATAIFTSIKGLGIGGTVSDAFTPTAAGTYRWRLSYSGDANYEPTSAPCNDANENSVVTVL